MEDVKIPVTDLGVIVTGTYVESGDSYNGFPQLANPRTSTSVVHAFHQRYGRSRIRGEGFIGFDRSLIPAGKLVKGGRLVFQVAGSHVSAGKSPSGAALDVQLVNLGGEFDSADDAKSKAGPSVAPLTPWPAGVGVVSVDLTEFGALGAGNYALRLVPTVLGDDANGEHWSLAVTNGSAQLQLMLEDAPPAEEPTFEERVIALAGRLGMDPAILFELYALKP